jgi:dihydrofolate synthase / folylpolyglutamate synthase
MTESDLDQKYRLTLDYLYSFVDYSLKKNFRYHPDQFDLGRMVNLLAEMGNPHLRYPVIHVAGTKGKGSVSALCESALQAAGYKTGLYTSPHLDEFTERIQVNREPIPRQTFIDLVDEFRVAFEVVPRITFFEITTALAFLYFARQEVDVAAIEVGLGGRLDATNICQPVVSVITSISYDHTAVLGDTLALIAAEKGGIIKNGIPVVVAPQTDEARSVLERIAEEKQAPLTILGKDICFNRLAFSLAGQSFRITTSNGAGPVDLDLALDGAHQVENAAVAYAALGIAAHQGLARLNDCAIVQGFKHVKWPGRFEVLQISPVVLLDCAHNRDSASKLRRALDEYFPGKPVTLVFGASEDKDIQGMLAELMPRVHTLVVVKSFHPRSIDTNPLVHLAESYGKPVVVIPDVADAIFEAISMTGQDGLVLVTGSIFVVAGARIAWLSRSYA